jgi:hypothetical protein
MRILLLVLALFFSTPQPPTLPMTPPPPITLTPTVMVPTKTPPPPLSRGEQVFTTYLTCLWR